MEPPLELFLGIGLVRNNEYVGLYLDLNAWHTYINTQVMVHLKV